MNNCRVIVVAYATPLVALGLSTLDPKLDSSESNRLESFERLSFLRPDVLECTLDNLDFGRYDSEGVSYIAELLGCALEDIISTSFEENQ